MIKKHAKDLIILLVLAIVLTVAFTCMDIQTVDEYYSTPLDKIENDSIEFSIDCLTLKDRIEYNKTASDADKKPIKAHVEDFVPEEGYLIEKNRFALKDGDSVFSVLKRLTAHYQMPISFKEEINGGVYLEGINHIFEKDCLGTSGWMYIVNGELPGVDMAHYILKPGDVVEIRYTCEYGDLARGEK